MLKKANQREDSWRQITAQINLPGEELKRRLDGFLDGLLSSREKQGEKKPYNRFRHIANELRKYCCVMFIADLGKYTQQQINKGY
ncbi:unnamed protein product [Parnassius mnemosyne]|uniref:Uncharacterized protein n=1 Tax=Parnassius mnemosyne TaxID=213953 RepID=A0AAV1KHG3_9NEOP